MFYARAPSRAASLSHAMRVIARLRTVTKIVQAHERGSCGDAQKAEKPSQGGLFFLAAAVVNRFRAGSESIQRRNTPKNHAKFFDANSQLTMFQ
jgi:hypothetical protein